MGFRRTISVQFAWAIASVLLASRGIGLLTPQPSTSAEEYRDVVRTFYRTERPYRIPRDGEIGSSTGTTLDATLEERIRDLLSPTAVRAAARTTESLTTDQMAHCKYMLAQAYHDANNFKEACLWFQKLITEDSNAQLVDDATYMIGYEYYLQKDYETAITWFSRVEKCSNRKEKAARDRIPFALYMIAKCHMGLRQNGAAISVLENLKMRYPKHAKVREANRLLAQMR